MPKTIDSIDENGVFKPLEKVNIKPQKKRLYELGIC
jgi:predicted DNA-binding antitoxin AbrB/MazE fold protein